MKNRVSRILALAINLLLFLLINSTIYAQTDQEFWFIAPEVNDAHGGGGQPTYLRIATYDLPSEVTISQPANPAFTPIVINIPANDTRSIEFRPGGGGAGVYDLNLIENEIQSPTPTRVGNINNVGLKISSTSNITAYYEISSNLNREIVALKGRNAVGRNFYVPFQTNFNNYLTGSYPLVYSAIDILATQATTVNIRPTNDMLIVDAGGDVVIPAFTTYSVNLNTGETFTAVPYGTGDNATYNISRRDRLAGTRVWSNDSALVVQTKDDLVHDQSGVYCNSCGGDVDYVADQLVPASLLGQTYVVMQGQITTVPEYVYVLATENATTVSLNGTPQAPVLNAGEQMAIRIDNLGSNFNLIEADHPVSVYHVSGFAGQMGGSILPQIDVCTGSQEVVFTRPQNFDFYMNILVRKGAENNFELNGVGGLINPIGGWTEIVPNEWMAGTVDATGIVATQTPQVLSNDDVFHLGIINGDGSTDCFYGYFSDFNKLDVSATIVGTIDGSKVLCYGKSTQLIASTGNSYLWTADATPYYIDDPTSQNPIVSPLTNRKYKVVVEGGCNLRDSAYVDIIVSDPIEASFALSDVLGCAPMDVAIVNHSEDNYPVSDYEWDMDGDNIPEYTTGPDTIYHTFDNTTNAPITYEIKLRTENILRCKDSLYADVTVHPAIYADFEPDTAGCNPLTVPFRNLSSGDTATFEWSFGDGATSVESEPVHQYQNLTNNIQTYTAQLVTKSPSYFCKDTMTQTVSVEPALYAQFHVDKNMGCAPLEVTPSNLSSPSASIDSYKWIWGDGDTTYTDNPGSHTYTNNTGIEQIYTLKLVAIKNSCTDTTELNIRVYPGVEAGFDQDLLIGCHPLPVTFQDTSTGAIAEQKWFMGDGTVINNQLNPVHQFENYSGADTTFNVQLIIASTNGCQDTAQNNITVHPYIKAGFTPNKIKGCADLEISVIDQSLGPVSTYEWDWGDGALPVNGSGPHSHTYTNATSGTLLYTAQQVVFNAAGCSDTITQLFEVYPEPDATFTAAPLSGCNPLDVDFAHTPTNNVDVQLSWDFGDASSGSDSAITHTYQHFNTTTTTFDVELAVQTARGCKDTATTTVDVGPYYDIAFTLDTAQGCSPFTIRPTNTSSGGIDTWTWKKEDVVFSSAQSPAAITLYNTTNNPIDTVITLIGSNSGGVCEDSMQRTVTIYPSVDATYIQDVDEGCNPLTVNFTHTPANNPVMSFNWDFDDNNSSALQNPAHTFVNNNATSKIFNVQLNVTSPYNCKDSANSVVTVGSYVDARMTVSEVSGCAPLQVEFEDISEGDVATRTWLRNGVAFSPNPNPQIIIDNNSGAVRQDTIMLIVENSSGFGCTDTAQKIITIYPEVDAAFNHPVTQGCNPLTVDFTHNPAFLIPVDYTWDFGDESSSNLANPTHTFNNQTESPRTYNIKLLVESQHGCKDSTYSSVEVASRLDAKFVMPAAAGCSPFSASFQDASVGDINSWQWYIDGNPVSSTSTASTTLNNTTNFNITQDVKLVVSNSGPGNCVDSVTKQITAYPEVTANFSQDTDRGCNPLPVNFTYEPGGNTVNVNHDWDFGDGTSSGEQDPPHNFEHFNYNGTTTFEVWHTTTSEYGCTDQQSSTVVVEKALKAEFAIDPSAGCNPFDATFVNTTQGADTYQWTFGDGDTYDVNVLQDVSHQYTNSSYTNTATFDAQLLVTNTAGNCRDSMIKTVSVYPNVRATYDLSSTEGCHPLTVDFTNTSLGSNNFYWDFDDQTSATVTNPTHTFTNFSSTNDVFYDVYLLATNEFECQDDTTATIRVNHLPKSQFTIDNTESCSPLEILAQNTSIGYDDFQWRLGNGETSSSATLNYTYTNTENSTASYQLELFTQTNRGCTDSSSLLLNVYPNVSADFNIETDRGCNPLTTAFDNLSVNADNFYWDFGDGTTSNQQNPTNRFEIQGYTNQTIPVKLVAASDYECTDSITKNVTVYVQPAAEFEADPATQQYPQSTVTITDLTNGGPFSYQWSFGDGNTSTQMFPGAHTYDTWGTYTIDLSVVNNDFNCADNSSESITIDPPMVTAEFNIDDTAGCVPHTVTFTAEASQYPDDNYDYLWDFGDGTSSTEQQPTYTFDSAATYPITLTVVGDNGAVNAAGSVKVYPLPEVSFTMEPRLLMIPGDQTQCYNLTQYASEYLWDFGDGSTSTDKNPAHYYSTEGQYTVSLTATSAFGCQATATRENYIEVIGKGQVVFPNAFTPSLAGPSDGAYSDSDVSNNIFHPMAEGVVEYNLYIYNRWGELMFESKDVDVGWDGYYNGKLCPQDVYIWKVEGKFINGKTFEKTGDVTLLR